MEFRSRAEQACGACKKLKRKCDKSLPQCALCLRTGRRCDYAILSPAPTAGDLAAVQERLAGLEQKISTTPLLSVQSDSASSSAVAVRNDAARSGCQSPRKLPVAFFLDIDCYTWSRMRAPLPVAEIPEDVLSLLAQDNAIIETSEEYFNTIHCWMPIISKKRLNLGISVYHGGPDIAMLFLAMRLMISSPQGDQAEPLYRLCKSFLASLEAAGCASYQYLQALLLVAIYEHSHAIYPAAWMTVGTCARYAEFLGLSCSASRGMELRPVTTWTEVEERRRMWWAVFILDRFISVGSRRKFCLAEPPQDGLFPVNDMAWDEGDLLQVQPRPISTVIDSSYSPFAQLCRAAMFVESAIETTWALPTDPSAISRCPALIDQMCGFLSILDREGCGDEQVDYSCIGPQALARSAAFVLIDFFACPEKLSGQAGYVMSPGVKSEAEIYMTNRAMKLSKELAYQTHSLVQKLSPSIETDEPSTSYFSKITPQILDVIYSSLATFYWFAAEEGDGAYQYHIYDMCRFLEQMGTRWRLGSEYLGLVGYHDSKNRSAFLT